MTRLPDKARLRGTLKKLATIPYDKSAPHDRATAAQEALDYLAMLAGIKPVLLVGRGFNEPAWIDGVLAIARAQDLTVIEGPYWDADLQAHDLPVWYAEHSRAAFAERAAWYVCRSRGVADEVRELSATAAPTIAQEARLLGYPECCVAAHYQRNLFYQRIWLDILRRKADSDEPEMRRLLADNAALEPETPDERSRLEAAMAVTPAPFTSVNMCDTCTASADGPARVMSRRYADLARAIDRGLVSELAMATA